MPRRLTILCALLLAGCLGSPLPTPTSTATPITSAAASATEPPIPTATPGIISTLPIPTATSTPVPDTPSPSPTPLPPPFCSPLGGYTLDELPDIVSQPFIAPRPGKDDGHHGIDLAHYAYKDKTTIAGAPVQTVLAGRVASVLTDSWPYGNAVIIESPPDQVPDWALAILSPGVGQSVYHLYAHLEAASELNIGDLVQCGELLGAVGNTGWSGNYHLHFEVRLGPAGEIFTEMAYYQTTTTALERANYEKWRFGGEFVPIDPMALISASP